MTSEVKNAFQPMEPQVQRQIDGLWKGLESLAIRVNRIEDDATALVFADVDRALLEFRERLSRLEGDKTEPHLRLSREEATLLRSWVCYATSEASFKYWRKEAPTDKDRADYKLEWETLENLTRRFGKFLDEGD